VTRRTIVATLLFLPLMISLFTYGLAGAGTITVNPNGPAIACHLAFTTTSGGSWTNGTINVTGDCNSVYLKQIGTAATGNTCGNFEDCGNTASDPITANEIVANYWTGTHELQVAVKVGGTAETDTSLSGFSSSCGWNTGDVAINDTSPTTNDGWITDSTATTALDASLPTTAGTVSSGTDEDICTTSGTSLAVWVNVQDTGTTNTGTAAYLMQSNSWCGSESDTATGGNAVCATSPSMSDVGSYPGWEGTLAPTSNDDAPAGCDLLDITGNESGPTQVAGTEYPYTLDFAGTVDDIVATDTSETSTTNNVQGKTFDTPYLQDIDPGPGLTTSQTISYMAATGDVVNPDFWCYSGGVWYNWGTISSNDASGLQYEPPNTGGGDTTASCWAGSWSITDIGTDLLNLGKDFDCVLLNLFEPTTCTGSNTGTSCVNWSAFNTSLQTRIPTAYVVESFTAATTLYNGITTAMSDGACDAPLIDPWNGDTTGVGRYLASYQLQLPAPSDLGCSGANSSTVGNLFGWRPWILDFEIFGVWMTTAAILWRMSPWHRQGDGIEIVESFGGLNIWGDYIPTHQTNEGSD
jgi:hypothetical protein